MIIKRLLFLTPVVVTLAFATSLVVASRNFDHRVNQLIISSIGDAEKLNPILYTDGASGDIVGFVFNGLVKYNENQELIGDLAESWKVEQISALYLKSTGEQELERLARKVSTAIGPGRLRELGIQTITPVRDPSGRFAKLEFRLSTAGRAFEEAVLREIPSEQKIPVLEAVITTGSGEKSSKEETAPVQAVQERLRARILNHPALKGRLLDLSAEGSGQFSVRLLGGEKELLPSLRQVIEKEFRDRLTQVETSPMEHHPILTFQLRRGVRWHDRAPFTSADVKFTYDKIMDEKTNTVRRPPFELIQSLETPDPQTVRVTYKKPFSPSLESWGLGVLPKHILEKEKDINTADFNRNPIGTGPFKFKEWLSDQRITLAANDNYFEGRPYLDQISYRIIPEPPLEEMEFFVGSVDLSSPQAYQYKRYVEDRRFIVYKQLANAYTYIGWNLKNPLFQDQRVREALTMAIDRNQIVSYLLTGLGVVSNGPFPPQMWYASPTVKPLPYDPARAKALLAEAGWVDRNGDGILKKDGKPFEFNLITNNGNVLRQNVAVLVQRQLAQVGIKVGIELYEWSVFIRDRINSRNFDATVLGWSLGLDPDVYEIWHSSQREKGFNFVGYNNPEVDRLLDLGRSEYDRETRRRIYNRIQELIYKDQPYTFLYVPESTPALHRGEFEMLRRESSGRYKEEEIQMTKVGLTYYLNQWFRTSNKPALAPE